MDIGDDRWKAIVRSCLVDFAGADARLVGPQLENIISAASAGTAPQFAVVGGRPNDWLEAAKFLVELATFVKTSIEVWNLLPVRSGRAPTSGELEHEQQSTISSVTSADRKKVCGRVVELLGVREGLMSWTIIGTGTGEVEHKSFGISLDIAKKTWTATGPDVALFFKTRSGSYALVGIPENGTQLVDSSKTEVAFFTALNGASAVGATGAGRASEKGVMFNWKVDSK